MRMGQRRAPDPVTHRSTEGSEARPRGDVPAVLQRARPYGGQAASRFLVLAMALALLITSGCGTDVSIPNPFESDDAPPAAVAPTATPAAAPVSEVAPATATPGPTPTPAFTPFWVRNHRLTEMWSGQVGAPGVVSFGMTSQQFCSFLVVVPQQERRLYVFNPYSQNYFWIDADAVGPVGAPERQPGAPPPGQNCAEAVYAD